MDNRDPSMRRNCFENQSIMQFDCVGFYGIPEMQATQNSLNLKRGGGVGSKAHGQTEKENYCGLCSV